MGSRGPSVGAQDRPHLVSSRRGAGRRRIGGARRPRAARSRGALVSSGRGTGGDSAGAASGSSSAAPPPWATATAAGGSDRPKNVVPIAKAAAARRSAARAMGSASLDAMTGKGASRGEPMFVEDMSPPPGKATCLCIECGARAHWRHMENRLREEYRSNGVGVKLTGRSWAPMSRRCAGTTCR